MKIMKAIDTQLLELRQEELIKKVDSKRKEMRPDRADMTFGEIINMYEKDEIIIAPEFQRGFRWKEDRQTKFIESLLLGIPIPPIFVAETDEGKWELVDGLQRLSTVLSFFGKLKIRDKNHLILTKGGLVSELEGMTIETLPKRYELALKRAVCRVEIIRYDSDIDMRYELFNRLNTGGVELSEQEIRNCIFRGYGNKFNEFITQLANTKEFKENIHANLTEQERMYLQELVLRYFTLKNKGTKYKHIQKHMDEYMLKVTKGEENFNYENEKQLFMRVMKKINDLGCNVFELVTLPFSTSVYDPIVISFAENIEYIDSLSKEEILKKIHDFKNDNDFRKQTTTSSSSEGRVTKKIQVAKKYFSTIEKEIIAKDIKIEQLNLLN